MVSQNIVRPVNMAANSLKHAFAALRSHLQSQYSTEFKVYRNEVESFFIGVGVDCEQELTKK